MKVKVKYINGDYEEIKDASKVTVDGSYDCPSTIIQVTLENGDIFSYSIRNVIYVKEVNGEN